MIQNFSNRGMASLMCIVLFLSLIVCHAENSQRDISAKSLVLENFINGCRNNTILYSREIATKKYAIVAENREEEKWLRKDFKKTLIITREEEEKRRSEDIVFISVTELEVTKNKAVAFASWFYPYRGTVASYRFRLKWENQKWKIVAIDNEDIGHLL